MSRAARVILLGLALTLAGVLTYTLVDTAGFVSTHQHYLRPLNRVVGQLLDAAWLAAFGVAALIAAIALWRLARTPGGRIAIAWKAFALLTLWAIGSFAFFFALFLAYVPQHGAAGRALLVPALLGCIGYLVIGLGFLLAAARKD